MAFATIFVQIYLQIFTKIVPTVGDKYRKIFSFPFSQDM